MRTHVKNVALLCGGIVAAVSMCAIVLAAVEVRYVYFDRHNLPDLGPFTRFEFSTVGHIYDARDEPLFELAREQREISRYEDIPPIVRDAILAAEDKRFFSHNGIDFLSVPRVLAKVRLGMLAGRLARGGRHDERRGSALFPCTGTRSWGRRRRSGQRWKPASRRPCSRPRHWQHQMSNRSACSARGRQEDYGFLHTKESAASRLPAPV